MATDERDEKALKPEEPAESRKPWEPMKVTKEGQTSELIQQGTKTSVSADPGDVFKPPGQG